MIDPVKCSYCDKEYDPTVRRRQEELGPYCGFICRARHRRVLAGQPDVRKTPVWEEEEIIARDEGGYAYVPPPPPPPMPPMARAEWDAVWAEVDARRAGSEP